MWKKKNRDLICFKCKKLGHIRYNFPLYKNEAKKEKKKAMVATSNDSKDDSTKEQNEKEMTFMTIDELDEVNSNLSYEDLQEAFNEFYGDLEKL